MDCGELVVGFIFVRFGFDFGSSCGKHGGGRSRPIELTGRSFATHRGLIYFLLAAYLVYACLPVARGNEIILDRVAYFATINFVLNGSWILIFAYKLFWVSVVVIFGMLLTLILIYERVGVNYKENMGRFEPIESVEGKTKRAALTTFQYWFVHTFSPSK